MWHSIRLIWHAVWYRKIGPIGHILTGVFTFVWGLGSSGVLANFPDHRILIGGLYACLGGAAFVTIKFMCYTTILTKLQKEDVRRIVAGFEMPTSEDMKFLNSLPKEPPE